MRHLPDLVSPREIVDSGLCIGCGTCAAARMRWDPDGFLKPEESAAGHDVRSESFSRQCPFSPAAPNEDAIAAERFMDALHADARIGRFEAAYVGFAAEDPFRPRGSSGGMTSWVAAELLRTGMVDGVAHVSPVDPHASGRFFEYFAAS